MLQIFHMELIKHQYSEPEEILNSDATKFQQLMHDKIYRINPKFVSSQQCMTRMLDFINGMEVSLKNLKLVKDLLSTFQCSILFFLKHFYQKSDATFTEAFIKQESDSESNIKKKGKYVALLLSISAIYNTLNNGIGSIPEFSFLTKYGTSEKQCNLIKSDIQLKFLVFLKKSFQLEDQMKDPNVRPRQKNDSLAMLEKEFGFIFTEFSCCFLQKMTFKSISDKFRSIIDSTKHATFIVEKKVANPSQIWRQGRGKIDSADLEAVKEIVPCCRRFFYEDEPIHHAQSFTLEYKNYLSPYDKYCTTNLKRTICGFLNRDGGIILVGIQEREDKTKQVRGQFYSQNQKEEVMKEYRSMCGQIYPDVIAQSKYKIKFVPIKSGNNKFIPGKYILRVEVAAGNEKNLYIYRDNKNEFAAFRTANQVLSRQINQETLLKFKQKLLNPAKINPIHEKPCPEPDFGQPIWHQISNKNKRRYNQDHQNQNSPPDQSQRKQNWTQKIQNASTLRKDKKPSDYVYFSSKPALPEPQQQKHSNNKFICDEDEQQSNDKKESLEDENQSNDENKPNNEDALDFKPLNPVLPKRSYHYQQKRQQLYVPKQENSNIKEPNPIIQVPYKLENVSQISEVNQKSINQTKSIDLLIVGYPYSMIVEDVKNYDLDLVERPINCNNDNITWLKLKIQSSQVAIRYELFSRAIMRKHQELNLRHKLSTRKLFSNLIFADEPFLNRLIHRYHHNEQFIDKDGCIYYALRNIMEAVEAYTIGWGMNIRMKFISDSDMKKKKLEHLKWKTETNR